MRSLALVLLAVALEEVKHQRLNVLAALAQGRKVDRHHVQPVIEVFAEPSGIDLVEQIAVRRRDDAGVDLLGVVVTNPLEFSFLKDAEQLDLELGRGAVDLVQEDRSRVCGLEPSGPIVNRAGE